MTYVLIPTTTLNLSYVEYVRLTAAPATRPLPPALLAFLGALFLIFTITLVRLNVQTQPTLFQMNVFHAPPLA